MWARAWSPCLLLLALGVLGTGLLPQVALSVPPPTPGVPQHLLPLPSQDQVEEQPSAHLLSLPLDLLHRVADQLPSRAALSLRATHPDLRAIVDQDAGMNVRFARRYPTMPISSAAQWYRTCLRDVAARPPHLPLGTLEQCFARVQPLDGEDLAQVRLQVLYDMASLPATGFGEGIPIIQVQRLALLRDTSWTLEQRIALLHFHALHPAAFPAVWEHFCLPTTLPRAEARLWRACTHSILALRDSQVQQDMLTHPSLDLSLADRQEERATWDALNATLAEAEAYLPESYLSAMLFLLQQGLPIHHLYFRSMLFDMVHEQPPEIVSQALDLLLAHGIQLRGDLGPVLVVPALVHRMLRAGADPDGLLSGREPLLLHAAHAGRRDEDGAAIVALLLEYGADVKVSNSRRATPCLLARRVDVALRLLAHGADPLAVDENGNGVLHYALRAGVPVDVDLAILYLERGVPTIPALVFAACFDESGRLMLALQAHGQDLAVRDHQGRTALMLTDRVAIAQHLLEAGVPINAQDAYGNSALLHAARADRAAVIRLLLLHGVDRMLANHLGEIPLMLTRSADIAAALLSEQGMEQVQARDHQQRNALDRYPSNQAVTRLLIERGAPLTPAWVQRVIRHGDAALLQWLSTHQGVDITSLTPGGRTALMDASSAQIAQALLDAGIPLDAQDAAGNTALMYAVQRVHADVVSWLLERGANPLRGNTAGDIPLMYATRGEVVDALLSRGEHAQLTSLDAAGRTALHRACMNPAAGDVIPALLRHGASPNVRARTGGKTPLMLAFARVTPGVFQALLSAPGVDVDVQDNAGDTVLMRAAQYPALGVVQALLARGARCDVRNRAGQSALDMVRASRGGSVAERGEIEAALIACMGERSP